MKKLALARSPAAALPTTPEQPEPGPKSSPPGRTPRPAHASRKRARTSKGPDDGAGHVVKPLPSLSGRRSTSERGAVPPPSTPEQDSGLLGASEAFARQKARRTVGLAGLRVRENAQNIRTGTEGLSEGTVPESRTRSLRRSTSKRGAVPPPTTRAGQRVAGCEQGIYAPCGPKDCGFEGLQVRKSAQDKRTRSGRVVNATK